MSLRLPASDTYEERKRRNTICFKPDYSPADLRDTSWLWCMASFCISN